MTSGDPEADDRTLERGPGAVDVDVEVLEQRAEDLDRAGEDVLLLPAAPDDDLPERAARVRWRRASATSPPRCATPGSGVGVRRARGHRARRAQLPASPWRRTSSRSRSVMDAASVATWLESMRRGPLGVDGVLLGDPTGPAGEEHDPVAEPHGFTDVVRHEEHREPGAGPECFELVVEQVSGHRVERAERLVHQEDVGALRRARGRARCAGACRRRARAAACRRSPRGAPSRAARATRALALVLGDAVEPQRELDVAGGRRARGRARTPGT